MTKKPAWTFLSRLQLPCLLLRCGVFALLLFTASGAGLAQAQPADPGDALIGFLNQSIAWYHRLQIPGELAADPSDSIYAGYNRTSSLEALTLIFGFARERAREIQRHSKPLPAGRVERERAVLPLPSNLTRPLRQAMHQRGPACPNLSPLHSIGSIRLPPISMNC